MTYTEYETLDGQVRRVSTYTIRILKNGMFRVYRDGVVDCSRAYHLFHTACTDLGSDMKDSGTIHDATVQLIFGIGELVASVEFKTY